LYKNKLFYINIPNVHQSTIKSWGIFYNISGAMYSGVPTNELVRYPGFNFLDNPKSFNFIYPFSHNNTFSGFKSLYTIPRECKYPNDSTNYAI